MAPTIFSTDPGRARRTLVAAILGGVLGGAIVPLVGAPLGAVAARATFAAAVVLVVLVLRQGRGIPARTAIAASLGGIGAAVEPLVPASSGLSTAILGLGLGLALAPEGFLGGPLSALGRASAAAAGALLGAAIAGGISHAEPVAALAASSPALSCALLGGFTALGAASGEAFRSLVLVPSRSPAEVEEARAAKLSAEARAIVEMARSAYLRVCSAVEQATLLDAQDRAEALQTAHELVLVAARSALAWDELGRTQRSVQAEPLPVSGTDGVAKLKEARDRVEAALVQRRQKQHEEAVRAATALAELALAVQDRSAPPVSQASELAARAQGLTARVARTQDTTVPEAISLAEIHDSLRETQPIPEAKQEVKGS